MRLVLVLVFVLVLGHVAHADDTLRVVIVAGDDADIVAARVDGQVSDLDVAMTRVADASFADAASHHPLEAAARLARAHEARVVVWFVADDGAWTVHVAEPAAGRVLSRRVEAEGELASSASAEAVALVVRGAIAAIAEGGSIGVAPPPPQAAAPVPVPVPVPVPDRSADASVFVSLGYTGVSAGPAVQHGIVARLGASHHAWAAALDLGIHDELTLDEPGAAMSLSRAALGAQGEYALVDRPGWRVSAALGASAIRFARVTISADAPLAPTAPETTWSPAVTADLRARRGLTDRVWLEAAAGADLLLRIPEFGVSGTGGFMTYARLDAVQPSLTVSLGVDAP